MRVEIMKCGNNPPPVGDSTVYFTAKEFFHAVFAPEHQEGFISFFLLRDKRVQYIALRDLSDVAAHFIDKRHSEPLYDLYFSVGIQASPPSRTKSRGTARDIVGITAFWYDLDCIDCSIEPTYRQLPTRLEALEFIAALPWSPSIVVDSGGGYHLYWLLREPWLFRDANERAEAAELSLNFQKTIGMWGEFRGWEFDLTADLSRVLRVPGTINGKKGRETAVWIANFNPDVRYNPSDFESYLLPSKASMPTRSRRVSNPKPGIALSIEPIITGCAWLRHCIDDAATLPEPEWFAMLTILAKLKDGKILAHLYSNPYSGYSMSETEWKFAHASTFRGTYSCSKISIISGGKHCASCQYQGKIRSPLSLSQQESFSAELVEIKDLLHRDGECIEQKQQEAHPRANL